MAQHNTIDHSGVMSYASNANQTSTANYGGAASTVSRGDHIHLSTGGSGAVATDAIWTTAGKVAVATGTATATEQYPQGYEMDYAEFTSPVTLAGTTEATATVIVTANSVTFDGSTIVMIECFIPDVANANSTDNTRLWLYEKVGAGAAASIGEIGRTNNPANATVAVAWPTMVSRRMTPSSAAIIYSIRGSSAGTASANAGAGGAGNFMPGYIRITKVSGGA